MSDRGQKASIDHKMRRLRPLYRSLSPGWIREARTSPNDILNKKIADIPKPFTVVRISTSSAIDVAIFMDCHPITTCLVIPMSNVRILRPSCGSMRRMCRRRQRSARHTGSLLDESDHEGHDHFSAISPETNWMVCNDHAVKLGTEVREYELDFGSEIKFCCI